MHRLGLWGTMSLLQRPTNPQKLCKRQFLLFRVCRRVREARTHPFKFLTVRIVGVRYVKCRCGICTNRVVYIEIIGGTPAHTYVQLYLCTYVQYLLANTYTNVPVLVSGKNFTGPRHLYVPVRTYKSSC